MSNSVRPIAKKEGLVIQELNKEVLVYDLDTHKAHCLNESAAMVWKNCDGAKNIGEIADLFSKESGSRVNEDFVWLAIDQLNELNLLEQKVAADFKGQNRREVLKRIGLATVIALPIVSSLVAPQATMAAASCNTGDVCNGDSDCNAGCTNGCQPDPGPGTCS